MTQLFAEIWKCFWNNLFFFKVKFESGVSSLWDDNEIGCFLIRMEKVAETFCAGFELVTKVKEITSRA